MKTDLQKAEQETRYVLTLDMSESEAVELSTALGRSTHDSPVAVHIRNALYIKGVRGKY